MRALEGFHWWFGALGFSFSECGGLGIWVLRIWGSGLKG